MTFYYEADDGMLMAGTSMGGKRKSKLWEALTYELGVIIVFGSLFIIGYLFLGKAEVPYRTYPGAFPTNIVTTKDTGNNTFTTANLVPMDTTLNQYAIDTGLNRSWEDMIIQVNIPTFIAGFMSFLGWFFFALFGGIGLAALPLDLFLAWYHRPTHMDPTEFAETQITIRNRVNELVNIGELIKLERDEKKSSPSTTGGGEASSKRGFFHGLSKEARAERNNYLEFKKAVYLLEEDVEEFQACSANYESYNPLWPWMSLFFAFFAFLISLAWIVHIVVFMVIDPPVYPLLNSFFQWFDQWFPLFGVLSVAIFTLYLLLAAVKGCFKFGIRFMFFEIHPMKLNKTYMSSFMFNVGLVLLCALPVVQFCTTAFRDYARYTNISQVMGTQVQNLKFFTWFWTSNVFVYGLLIVSGLTCLYLFCKPRDKTGMDSKGLRERISGRWRK